MTICDTHNSKYTWFACVGISMLGGILGCCLIPFYLDQFKDADHACGTCGCDIAYKKAFQKD